jgi:hypothetical protein
MKISSRKTKREIGHLGFLGIYGDDIKNGESRNKA